MWWTISSIILIVLAIYYISYRHKKHIDTHITKYGGMLCKYKIIIDHLVSSGLQIKKVTSDSVLLSSGSMYWRLDYVGINLEIQMNGYHPLLGNISNKWRFQDGYSQEKIVDEFKQYAFSKMEELKNISKQNAFDHIKIK